MSLSSAYFFLLPLHKVHLFSKERLSISFSFLFGLLKRRLHFLMPDTKIKESAAWFFSWCASLSLDVAILPSNVLSYVLFVPLLCSFPSSHANVNIQRTGRLHCGSMNETKVKEIKTGKAVCISCPPFFLICFLLVELDSASCLALWTETMVCHYAIGRHRALTSSGYWHSLVIAAHIATVCAQITKIRV